MNPRSIPAGATWDDLAPWLADLVTPAPTSPRAHDGIVVATSGSSGTPKLVHLSGAALRASGEATATALGGHGRWILALPTHHVAGLQVLARSVLAGTSPIPVDPATPFCAASLAAATDQVGSADHPVFASLVPTQLHRLLQDGSGLGAAALAAIDVVLLGGAAADPALLQRARAVTRVVTTYGMTETCGGCVYDGTPLPGVTVRIDPGDDRIHLGGAVLADGYADHDQLTAERFVTHDGQRWFVTDDRGVWRDGRLTVLGRLDDVIVTGGHKVEPRDVEQALRALPGVGQALVVGLPDDHWGQQVGALLIPEPAPGTQPDPHQAPGLSVPGARPALAEIRAALALTLPAHALPHVIGWCDAIPLLASGKPDRTGAVSLLNTHPARGGQEPPK